MLAIAHRSFTSTKRNYALIFDSVRKITYRTGESAELRSCVKVEVAVLVSVDVKQH